MLSHLSADVSYISRYTLNIYTSCMDFLICPTDVTLSASLSWCFISYTGSSKMNTQLSVCTDVQRVSPLLLSLFFLIFCSIVGERSQEWEELMSRPAPCAKWCAGAVQRDCRKVKYYYVTAGRSIWQGISFWSLNCHRFHFHTASVLIHLRVNDTYTPVIAGLLEGK